MVEPEPIRRMTDVFQAIRPKLHAYLVAAFPRLANEVEDILQNVWSEAYQKVARENFLPAGGWQTWLRLTVRSRAIDCLRHIERRIFVRYERDANQSNDSNDGYEPVAGHSSPSESVLERERRYRQGLLLSEVLVEFCRWCEQKQHRLAIKEAYERSLHGQKAGQIAQAMQADPESVYQWLHQARQWIRNRISEKDVARSVFLTLYGGNRS